MSDNSEIKFKAIGNNRNRNIREQSRTSHSNISATKEDSEEQNKKRQIGKQLDKEVLLMKYKERHILP